MPQLVAGVEPPLIIVANAVAVLPTWTDRLNGSTAETIGLEAAAGEFGRAVNGHRVVANPAPIEHTLNWLPATGAEGSERYCGGVIAAAFAETRVTGEVFDVSAPNETDP